jgi:hypothetical protein
MTINPIQDPARSAILRPFLLGILALFFALPSRATDIFVEAESFEELGGWSLDTQFVQQMGSPYLLAHGLGNPVADAVTTVQITEPGTYKVWVRTIDWVARWNASPAPGQFQLLLNGTPLKTTFGTQGKTWGWHDGGTVELASGLTELRLHDLTGFDGRADCIFLSTAIDSNPPPADKVLSNWRRKQLNLTDTDREQGPYDLVVVGGGYAGMASAISAARMGCKVALIQDRPVLGGNGSSEVRVWAMGLIRRGKFPRVGEIVEEFADRATKSPGTAEEFGDALKEQIVRAESNIDLLLNHHAYAVNMDGNKIASVKAFDTRTGADTTISGSHFVDCTGHGWIGDWAGASYDMTPTGRMGMSNMWRWDDTEKPTSFPETPWALDLNMKDFPYPRDNHGQWFWESGFDIQPIQDAEAIRDWNLRAVYGAFNAMKNRDGAEKHKNATLSWVAFVGGPRESRRLLGDVLLTREDIVEKREFPDGCVPSTWSIDLHYPKKQYAIKYADNPFISIAEHDNRVDRMYGYPVPYRCFYSRNIDNLFMAGRCISVTHEALGTVRVMKTCGMMGEVVGKAASICVAENCSPRGVYEQHLDELLELLRLPGVARRASPQSEIVIPDNVQEIAGAWGPATGLNPAKLEGIVVDDRTAFLEGPWTEGTGLKGYVGWGYRYASANSNATCRFTAKVNETGTYQLELYSLSHENRGTNVPVIVDTGVERTVYRLNQRDNKEPSFIIGSVSLVADQEINVVVHTEGAGGMVHIDAIRLIPTK